jgi:hypothetical protein
MPRNPWHNVPLLNPEHPDAKQAEIAEVIHEQFDNRFIRFGTR